MKAAGTEELCFSVQGECVPIPESCDRRAGHVLMWILPILCGIAGGLWFYSKLLPFLNAPSDPERWMAVAGGFSSWVAIAIFALCFGLLRHLHMRRRWRAELSDGRLQLVYDGLADYIMQNRWPVRSIHCEAGRVYFEVDFGRNRWGVSSISVPDDPQHVQGGVPDRVGTVEFLDARVGLPGYFGCAGRVGVWSMVQFHLCRRLPRWDQPRYRYGSHVTPWGWRGFRSSGWRPTLQPDCHNWKRSCRR